MKKRALAVLLALCMAFGSPAFLSAAEQGGDPTAKQEEVQGEDPSDPDSGKEQTDEEGNTDTGEGTRGENSDGAGSVKGKEIQDPLLPENDNDPTGEETEETVTEEEVSLAVAEETFIPGEKTGQDSETLFSAYVERAFNGNSDPVKKTLLRSAGHRMTGLALTGSNKVIYMKVASALPDIAGGKQASTIITVPAASLGTLTAEDLGVEAIVANGSVTQEAYWAFRNNTDVDLNLIIAALLADYPYELYWYDKTGKTTCTTYHIGYRFNNTIQEYEMYIMDDLKISFPVSGDFAAGTYKVDTSIGGTVEAAAANAQSIVKEFAGFSDEDKLYQYKERICDLVSYNNTAAGGDYDYNYGNPWQLIWVFDKDEKTNVVCEGYSKAFKYLCDQSSFDSDIRCITVTGTLSSGKKAFRHMWNVVSMDDGRNYLADLTNCDGTAESNDNPIGYPNLLFMTDEATRDTESGYVFDIDGYSVKYAYDDYMPRIYTEKELVIGRRSQEAASILAASVSFKEKIGLNYYIDIPEEYLEDDNAYIEYIIDTPDPKSTTVPLSKIPKVTYKNNECRKLTVDTVVKSIHDKITFNIFDGEGRKLSLLSPGGQDITKNGFVYSVAGYCDDIEKQSSNAAMKDLARKLKEYGLYVQKYLDYKADAAVPALDVSGVTAEHLEKYKGFRTDEAEGLSFNAFSFMFREESALRFKFKLSAGYNIGDYSFTVNGKTVEPYFNGSQYVIEVGGIVAKELGTEYVVKVTGPGENNSQTLSYSGISYARALIQSGSSEAARNAARAMYLYYEAAAAYFN